MRPEVLQSVALAVAEARSVESVFGGIVRGLGAEGDIALARIWLIEPGDICSSCPMRAECPDQSRCLHLRRECRSAHTGTRRLVSSRGGPASLRPVRDRDCVCKPSKLRPRLPPGITQEVAPNRAKEPQRRRREKR